MLLPGFEEENLHGNVVSYGVLVQLAVDGELEQAKEVKTFLKEFGEVPCFSIITMVCDDFKISGEKDNYTMICNSLPAMERAIYKVAEDKPIVFDDTKKQEIFDYIKNNQHIGKDVRTEHKQNVIAYKENLEEMKKQKICPYCKSELVLRNGKNGKFYGCKNFPKCRYTMKFEE